MDETRVETGVAEGKMDAGVTDGVVVAVALIKGVCVG
jgi:hypothetical protein